MAGSNTELDSLFNPQSIAIIGASNNLSSISGRSLKYLLKHGFEGRVFPVNPKYSEISGIKCYPSLVDVPGKIDLAIITRPREHVLDSLESCAKKGVSSAVIFSSGFAEIGEEGQKAQDIIRAFASKSNMRVLGPNCLGFVNVHKKVTASFGGSLERDYLIPGKVGFLSQSGAFSNLTFRVAQDVGIGFSYWISTGNEMDIGFSECLEFLINDKNTELIPCFIEGLRNGEKFLKMADKAIAAGKALIAIKVGKSNAGAKASLSHTGAMAGSDNVYEAVFEQKRIIRAHSIEELIDYIFVLLKCQPPTGRNVGIITITGGGAILMADRFEELGLRVPSLKNRTKEKMSKIVPSFGSVINPVDLTGQLIDGVESISKSINILMADDEINVIVVFIGMLEHFKNDLVKMFERIALIGGKPMGVVWMVPPAGVLTALREVGIPVFEDPIRCADAMTMLVKHYESVRKLKEFDGMSGDDKSVRDVRISEKARDIDEVINSSKRNGVITEYNAKRILESCGIPTPRERIVRVIHEAIEAADSLGYPVALKILSPQIPHRAKMGLIKLGIKTADEVNESYNFLISRAKALCPDVQIEGLLVQEMLPEGIEFIMGMKHDPTFGSVISIGMGGIFVEVIKKISLRVAPISRLDAAEMILNLKEHTRLSNLDDGYDWTNKIIEILLKFSHLCLELEGKVREIDINPIIVSRNGQAKVADALMVV